MLATTSHHNPPPPPGCADLSTPELMAVVMRRTGEGTTRQDFLRAAETCHLTEAQLEVNIGTATRILLGETERQVFPMRPLQPWEADPSYAEDLGPLIAGMFREQDIFAVLRRAGLPAAFIGDYWDRLITAGSVQFATQRSAPIARIVADLGKAVEAFAQQDLNAEYRELVRSMRAVLEAMRDGPELSRQHLLRTAETFAYALEVGAVNREHAETVTAAVALLRDLWGM